MMGIRRLPVMAGLVVMSGRNILIGVFLTVLMSSEF
jgi:hypothetical protein